MSFLDDIGFSPSWSNPLDILGNGNPLTGNSSQESTNLNKATTGTEDTSGSASSATSGISQSNTLGESVGSSNTQTGGSSNTQSGGTNYGNSNVKTNQAGQFSQKSQTQISQEGLMYLLNETLGGNNGLANLLTGEKGAGTYDSATTQLLAGDLLARAAGEVESRNAITTSSGVNSQTGATAGQTSGGNTGFSNTQNSGFSNTQNQQQNMSQTNTANQSNTNTTQQSHKEDVGNTAIDSNTSGSGSQGLLQSLGGGSGIGAMAAATVICTELHSRGILSSELYFGQRSYNASRPKEMIAGYHFWAIPYVRLMKKSQFATWLVTSLTIKRAEWIVFGKTSFLSYFAKFVMEPASYLLGCIVLKSERLKKLKKEHFAHIGV